MNVDLTKVHNLSGPIAVEGSEPGDCLVVDILDGKSPERGFCDTTDWLGCTLVKPFDQMPWGYTVTDLINPYEFDANPNT